MMAMKDWKTSLAGIIIAALSAVVASPVDHPFSQQVHDWSMFTVLVVTGLGFHVAADATAAVDKKIYPLELQPEEKDEVKQ